MRGSVFRVILALSLQLSTAIAFAQEREWSFDTGEADAYLVFGVPETDDVGVSFWCTIGSGEVRVFLPEAGDRLSAGEAVKIDFAVAGKHFNFTGETSVNEEAATTSAETRLDSGNPVFAQLLTADRFTVKIGKDDTVFPLLGADFDSLLRVCSRQ